MRSLLFPADQSDVIHIVAITLTSMCYCQAYEKFWDAFGKNLKLGCTEDISNHKRIAPLLRFYSSKSEDSLMSLDQYVERMQENQKEIYFLAAENIMSAKNAPFVEDLLNRDLEAT